MGMLEKDVVACIDRVISFWQNEDRDSPRALFNLTEDQGDLEFIYQSLPKLAQQLFPADFSIARSVVGAFVYEWEFQLFPTVVAQLARIRHTLTDTPLPQPVELVKIPLRYITVQEYCEPVGITGNPHMKVNRATNDGLLEPLDKNEKPKKYDARDLHRLFKPHIPKGVKVQFVRAC